MIAIRSSLLFWTSISIILIECPASLVIASNTPPKKTVPTKPPLTKKDPINEIAQKIYDLKQKQPTEKDQEELERFLKEKESLLNKRPQCQRELKLIAEDLAGRRKANASKKENISNLMKNNLARITALQKMRQQGKPTPVVDVNGPGITAAREQIAQKSESVTPAQPEQKPKSITEFKAKDVSITPRGAEGLFETEEEPEEKKEENVIKTTQEIMEQAPRIKKPETVAKQEQEEESEATSKEYALILLSSFEKKIAQPLQLVVQKEPEKEKIINTVLTNVADTLLEFKPESQEKIISATNTAIQEIEQMATPEQKSLRITENIVPLLQATETTIVPVANFAQILTKTGIQYTKKAEGIDFSDLNYFLYEATRNANLTSPDYQKLIAALTNTVTTITEKLVIASPLITTTLALQSTPESDIALLNLFNMLLKNLDALLIGTKIRTFTGGNALAKKLNNYKTTIWGFRWTQTQPDTIVPQLLALYAMLKTVGPELIYAIEVFIKKYETVIPLEIIDPWKRGIYVIKEYLNEESTVLHKRNYTNELIVLLGDLKKQIELGIEAISDINTKKKLQNQLDNLAAKPLNSLTKKTFTEQRKKNETKIPQKTTPTKRKPKSSTDSGLGKVFEETRRSKRPGVRTIKPIEEKKPKQLDQPLVPVVQVEPFELPKPEPETIVQKQLTAYPIVSAELSEIIKAVNALDPQSDTLDAFKAVNKKIEEFNTTELSTDQTAQYATMRAQFNQKYSTIQTKESKKATLAQIQEDLKAAIKDRKIFTAQDISNKRLLVITARKGLNDAEFKTYEKNFTQLLTQYAQVLVQIMQEKSKDLTSLDLDTISQCAATVVTINNSVKLSITQSIKDIMVTLCTFYDQALHMLYTPEEFNKILSAEKEEAAAITLKDYSQSVDDIKDIFISLANILTQLSTFIDKNDSNALEQKTWDISTLDPKLVENNAYKFAIAADTPVIIGDKTINTLQELNALHMKEYEQILEDWKNRIELDDTIQELKAFDVETSTPKSRTEIQDKLAKIAETLPRLLTSIPELQKLNEKITTLTETDTLSNKLAKLLEQINTADAALKSPKKTITKIDFESTYKDAQAQITKLGDLGASLQKQLADINTILNGYLTQIVQTSYSYLPGFPKRGYDGGTDLNTSIIDMTFPADFINMLTQLNNLNLLADIDKTTNPFNSLYQVILKNYCYILATFDAITAKLFDGAQSKQTWSEFIGFSTQKGQYESSIALLDGLLVPLAEKRSKYYELLIEPYFMKAQAIQNYRNGTLNLMTLGLANITDSEQNYRYARSTKPIAPGLEKTLLMQSITGIHMLSKNLNAPIVHGGDTQYKEVIDNYRFILEGALASERIALLQKQAIDALDAILNIPFGEPSDEPTLSDKPKYKNKFGTLYENFGNENIPNPYAYLNDILNEDQNYKIEYLDTFFKRLAQKLKNPKALDYLKELGTKNFNTEIQNKIKDIFGNSFALLDSIIAWPYHNFKSTDSANRKELIGIVLGLIYNNITSIFESLNNFRPYLLTKYKSPSFNVVTYVRQAPVIPVQPKFIRTKITSPISTTYTFAIPEKQSPLKQDGTRTQKNTNQSLEGLRMLINILGQKIPAPTQPPLLTMPKPTVPTTGALVPTIKPAETKPQPTQSTSEISASSLVAEKSSIFKNQSSSNIQVQTATEDLLTLFAELQNNPATDSTLLNSVAQELIAAYKEIPE